MIGATRIRGCPRWLAILLAGLVLAACVWSAIPAPAARSAELKQAPVSTGTVSARSDIQLYRAVSGRVANGEGYYSAAAREQRAAGYPVLPMQAIRLPTLAWLLAALGPIGSRALLVLLAVAAALAWYRKLADQNTAYPAPASWGATLVALGLAAALHPSTVYSHEAWAGTLIVLTLGIHRPGRAAPAILTGAFAVLLRELALPFLLLMAALAVWNRRWGEFAGWILAVAVFLAALWFHAEAHAAIAIPGDRESPGWLTLLGIAGLTGKVKGASVLGLLPSWAIGPSAILCLAGWLAWRGEFAAMGALFHVGYAMFYCLFGRADNYYWGFVSMPTLLVGVLVLPSLVRDLLTCLTLGEPDDTIDSMPV